MKKNSKEVKALVDLLRKVTEHNVHIKEADVQFTFAGGEDLELEGYIKIGKSRIQFKAVMPIK